jgi:dienelactone hydrolase
MRMDRSPSRLARRLLMLALVLLPPSALAADAAPSASADAPAPAATPAPPDLDALLRDPSIAGAALSPNGRMVALLLPSPDRTTVHVLNLEPRTPLGTFDFGEDKHIQGLRWIDNDHVLFGLAEKRGRYDYARPLPGSYVGRVGGNRVYVIPEGYEVIGRSGAERGQVMLSRWSGQRNYLHRFELGGMRPSETLLAGPPEYGRFILDHLDEPRYFVAGTDDLDLVVWKREDDRWVETFRGAAEDAHATPFAVAADGRLYAWSARGGTPTRIGLLDPATGTFEELASHPEVDASDLLFSDDERTLLAVRFDAERPEWRFVAPGHPDARKFRSLVAAFPGDDVWFPGRSLDGQRVLVVTGNGRDPGQTILYDREAGTANGLFAFHDALAPEALAERRHVRFAARDGQALNGYLTLPIGREARDLPLVLVPHGGPHGLRDTWGFDLESQILASRGYAVLQVNFRGSGGYGLAFESAGYGQWGRVMQDDMADGVRWAIAEGIADADRVCVYGASYGGYSALMQPIREPGLYRCAAGYVGVYDLDLEWRQQRREGRFSRAYFQRVLPASEEERRWQSPAHRAAEIGVPVLLAHAGRDERVPMAQYEALVEALEAAGRPPEVTIVKPNEGHGFSDPANQREFYEALLAFLDRHIGEGRAVAPGAGE